MAQFGRPVSDSENNWPTGDGQGGFEDINESSRSDSDFANSQDNPTPGTGNNGYFRVNLGSVTSPDTGTVTIRWASALFDTGVVASDAGTGCNLLVQIVEGASTVIATLFDAAIDGETSWSAHAVALSTPERDAVGDWSDLDLVFDADGGGGSPGNRRGAGISWAEMETPDEAAVVDDFPVAPKRPMNVLLRM